MLKGKNVCLCVTGGIAAYKAAAVASGLVKRGARVDVIMTKHAQEFITPLTFRSITKTPVVTDMSASRAQWRLSIFRWRRRPTCLL